jgi:hypothetical protein
MEFAVLPPAINCAGMCSGPGSGPMLAASAVPSAATTTIPKGKDLAISPGIAVHGYALREMARTLTL